MKKYICLGLCILFLLNVSIYAQDRNELCINFAAVSDWSPAWMFVDRMKNARGWFSFPIGTNTLSENTQVPLDEYGYPYEIPYDPDGAGPLPPLALRTSVFADMPYFPRGVYTLIYDGTGEVRVTADQAQIFTQSGVPHSVNVFSKTIDTVTLSILSSSSSDPVRNIRFIMPGFESNYDSQIFHPLFLSRLEPYSVLRFMTMQNTIATTVTSWDERTSVNSFSQAAGAVPAGLAPEYMAELSNRTGAHPWISIPHLADDSYVRGLAQVLYSLLDPSLNVYIEYSNECWNWAYAATHYVVDSGLALGLSSNNLEAGMFFYARRSAEIFKIFEEEFGGTDRLVRIAASQAGYPWISDRIMYGMWDSTINPTDARPDVLAVAPYFGGEIPWQIHVNGETSTISVDEILDRLEASVYTDTVVMTAESNKIAQQYGIPLISYEGGSHLIFGYDTQNSLLISKIISASRHPRMKEIMLANFSAWRSNGGGLFTVITDIEKPGRHNPGGMLHYQDEPISDAPMYQAVLEYTSRSFINYIYLHTPENLRVLE